MKFLSKKMKSLKNRKLNNKGSAIVFVVVIMALMGILVMTSCYMAVSNFYMKANDFQTKNNLYSAEGVLEEIKAGIQQQASAATDIAYLNVMQNYTVFNQEGDNAQKARSDEFVYQYITHLRNYYQSTSQSPRDNYYDIDKIKKSVEGKVNLIDVKTENAVGAEISVNGMGDVNEMIAYSDALIFKNISVKYKDSKGYVTMITTDIRVDVPEISFDSAMSIPEIISYSLIANESLEKKTGDNVTISGSVYGGRQGILADGDEKRGIYFKGSDMVITPNLVTADNKASITFDKDTTLWAGGTVVDRAGTLNLLGNSYIEDDTTVQGRSSNLNISGQYLGFGDETAKAEKSSSIIINGVASKVNLTDVKRLLLPGNAFIGVESGTETIKAPDGRDLNSSDVGLGESMTAKASQIAYLVPSECIGYIDGKCVLGSNPVLYSKWKSEYYDKTAKEEKKEVDFSKISNNGTDYEKEYGASFKNKFVSVDNGTSNGDALVYYYITFNNADNKLNQENAAKFFKDYFEDNEENIRRYLDIYVDTLNVDADDILRLNVAGNLLSKVDVLDEDGNVVMETIETKDDDGKVIKTEQRPVKKYELINETKTSDNAAGIEYGEELTAYKSVFRSLISTLTKTDGTDDLVDEVIEIDPTTKTYAGGGIFKNLIDEDAIKYIMDSVETQNSIATYGIPIAEFKNETEGVKALVVDNKNGSPYELDNETPLSTSLLIATGDVVVERTFGGTIIAGGKITVNVGDYIDSTVEINHDRDMVRHVLDIENTFTKNDGSGTTEKYSPMKLFKTGVMNIATSSSEGDENSEIVIEDLVSYENWTKQ